MTLNFSNKIVNKEHFPFFEIKDILPVEFYNTLRKDIIEIYTNELKKYKNFEENLFNATSKGALNFIPSFYIGGGREKDSQKIFYKLSQKYTSFKTLIEYFNNEKFCNKIYSILEKKNLLKINKLRDPEYKLSFLEYLLFNNYYINFKLSFFTKNSGLGLHRDHGSKEVALLLYFGFSDNIDRNLGGTQCYKSSNKTKKFVDHEIDVTQIKNFQLIYDKKPEPNSIFGFKKTLNSWHGVNKMKLPDNVYRINLQINFMRLDTLKNDNFFINKIKYKILNIKIKLYKFFNNEI